MIYSIYIPKIELRMTLNIYEKSIQPKYDMVKTSNELILMLLDHPVPFLWSLRRDTNYLLLPLRIRSNISTFGGLFRRRCHNLLRRERQSVRLLQILHAQWLNGH